MIRKYSEEDKNLVINLFATEVDGNKNYISHGEVQMGLSKDGKVLTKDFLDKWIKYLDRQAKEEKVHICVYESNNAILGFIIFGIESDFDKDYAIIYDLIVSKKERGAGIGKKLLNYALNTLKDKGITNFFLESGIHNHNSHKFFEQLGFNGISSTFWLNTELESERMMEQKVKVD